MDSYKPPVTKKQTKKAMYMVVAFMIGGSLLISLARFALIKADSQLKDPKTTPPNSLRRRRRHTNNQEYGVPK